MFSETHGGWYVLFVQANHENIVKQRLEQNFGEQLEVIMPRRRLKERKGGKWQLVERNLFPGYILIKGDLSIDLYYRIKKIPNIFKFLRDDQDFHRITDQELRVLNILTSGSRDGTIGFSTIYKENDIIQVIDGPLKGLEGLIVSINPRKGRAKVKLSIANNEKTVELGIEMVDKI